MISVLLSRLVLLVFGTLYPAYASYKTVKTKNVKDYVRWMMYWIVFALYTFIEIFADIFIAFWFPFYYELKIIFVLWLVCPATRGSTYIFRRLINPQLSKHEKLIDAHIASFWDHGYDVVRKISSQGVDYLIETVWELFRKGQITATSLLPKAIEVAQQEESVIQNNPPSSLEHGTKEAVSAEEEFDILMLENYDSCSDTGPSSAQINSQRESSESASDSEDTPPSVKSRPLKLSTRSKTKALAVKKRKKLNL